MLTWLTFPPFGSWLSSFRRSEFIQIEPSLHHWIFSKVKYFNGVVLRKQGLVGREPGHLKGCESNYQNDSSLII
jgi:hypothetical protein